MALLLSGSGFDDCSEFADHTCRCPGTLYWDTSNVLGAYVWDAFGTQRLGDGMERTRYAMVEALSERSILDSCVSVWEELGTALSGEK